MPKDLHPELTAFALAVGAECRWESVRGTPYVAQFHLMRDGIDLFCEPSFGSKGGLMGIDVFARITPELSGTKTRLTREGSVDRLGKELGVTRELQTGDSEFDKVVFIESDAPDQALARFFGPAEVRDGVRAILALAAVEVGLGTRPTCETQGAGFVRLGITWASTRDRALIERLFSAVVHLANACGSARIEAAGYRGQAPAQVALAPVPPRRVRGAIATLVVVLPALLTAFLPTDHTLGGHLVLAGFGAAFGLWLVQGALLAIILRGRSSSFSLMLTGWAAAFVGILFVARVGEGLNELLDNGRASRHHAYARFHVAAKGPSFVEVTAIWLPDKPTARTPQDDANIRPSEGDVLVTAVTRPGAFGVPWIEKIERIAPGE